MPGLGFPGPTRSEESILLPSKLTYLEFRTPWRHLILTERTALDEAGFWTSVFGCELYTLISESQFLVSGFGPGHSRHSTNVFSHLSSSGALSG